MLQKLIKVRLQNKLMVLDSSKRTVQNSSRIFVPKDSVKFNEIRYRLHV